MPGAPGGVIELIPICCFRITGDPRFGRDPRLRLLRSEPDGPSAKTIVKELRRFLLERHVVFAMEALRPEASPAMLLQ
jgi:hypothetical protein